MTSWTIRGSAPLRADDECDVITPWIVHAFTTQWNHTQQRIAAHTPDHNNNGYSDSDGSAAPTEPPDAQPPPF